MMMITATFTTTTTTFCSYFLLFVVVIATTTTTTTTLAAPPKKPISLQLHHRLHLDENNSTSYESYLQSQIRRDPSRRKWIAEERRRHNRSSSSYGEELYFSMPIGNQFEGGEYLIFAGVGDPPSVYRFQVDTGSDVPWLQCEPCVNCYKNQKGDIYDPKESESYRQVMNNDIMCQNLLDARQPPGPNGECMYQLGYADGGITKGYVILDDLTLFSTDDEEEISQVMTLGCGVDNNEKVNGAQAGILALSKGPLSLVSTLDLTSFSYCLVNPRDRRSESTLILDAYPPDIDEIITDFELLSVGPAANTLFYVDLTAIKVNNAYANIPQNVLKIDPNNAEAGVILDSGTTYTYFTLDAYTPLKTTFVQQTRAPAVERRGMFDLCFDVSGVPPGFNPYPTLTYIFRGGSMDLRLETYIQRGVETGVDCFTILPEDQGVPGSVIGVIQQYGMRFYFSIENHYVAITNEGC